MAVQSPMQMAPQSVLEPHLEERAELLVLLASKTFARAPLVSKMLAYVCEQHFRDGGASIKEYSVATNGLGRGEDFNPETDTIVRVMASRLRRKLVEYYATEGSLHKVKIYLSESGYSPLFVVEPQAEPGPATRSAAMPRGRSLKQLVTPLLAGLCILLAGATLWFASRPALDEGQVLAQKGPLVKALWSQLLRPGQPTDLVVADSTLVLYQNLTGQTISLTDYITRQYLGNLEASEKDVRRRADLTTLLARRYTSVGDVRLLTMLLPLAFGINPGIRPVFARDYSPDSMQRDNVILLGTSHSNPWVSSYDNVFNFRFETSVIRNVTPIPGEQPFYSAELIRGGTSHGYAVAAFLPNLGRTGNVLVLSGSESEGTEAAGQFVASEESLQRLRQLLPAASRRGFPHFEVLLRTTRVSGAPGGAEIVAVRSHP